MSLIESLRPKTKKGAIVTLVGTVTILIAYFVWTDTFILASIYIAILGPLALFLFTIFDLAFSSIMTIWSTSPRTTEKASVSKSSVLKPSNSKSTLNEKKLNDDDLFDMEGIPA